MTLNKKLSNRCLLPLCMFVALSQLCSGGEADVAFESAYATNAQDGTKIHFKSVGEGPLVVFVHGFPDFWYSWKHQMKQLSKTHRCVAMDLRGYNNSDKPAGIKNYDMPLLVGDVLAVIEACGAAKATVVGHDWGGAISWATAMSAPDRVDKLIICNLPHPRGLKRELLINDEHRANTQYARDFQDPDYHKKLTPELLVAILKSLSQKPWTDEKTQNYLEAFRNSDFEAMLSYYRQNYTAELEDKPPLPYQDDSELIQAKMPVLMFHGLKDKALHHHALNNTWEWVEKDLTIVTLPNASHWVHHDEQEFVTETMEDWLERRR